MRKLLPYLKPYRKECILSPLFKLLEVLAEMAVPLVVARLIDQGLTQATGSGLVIQRCLLLVLLGAAGFGVALSAQYFAAKASALFSAKVRSVLMAQVQSLSCKELDQMGSSTLINRLTTDVNLVQTGVNMFLRLVLRSPFVVVGATLMAVSICPSVSIIFIGMIAALAFTVILLMHQMLPGQKEVQSSLDTVLSHTQENLAGVRVLRAFGKQEAEMADFNRSNFLLLSLQKKLGKIFALMNPLTYALVNVALVILLYFSGKQVNAGTLTQGETVALVNYLSQILVELVKLANLIVTISKAIAGAQRIEAVLNVSPSMGEAERVPEEAVSTKEAVFFHNVSFKYAGAGNDALRDISFSVKPGQTVGIVGATGCGKSTLAQLLPRLYDATEGEVCVFGRNVRDWPSRFLRENIALVPQKTQLVRGTIRDNLLWGNPNASDEEIWEALRAAQAAEIVEGKEGELSAPVEQEGRNFSGGQKQRLAIARAFLKKAPILILDDSFCALDYLTEARLREGLKQQKSTVFIISQRIHSVRQADLILVLEDGCLVGSGTHEELMKSCKTYREIVSSQNPDGEAMI